MVEGPVLPSGTLDRLLATYRAIQASQSDVDEVMRLTVQNVRSLLVADYSCIWRAGQRAGGRRGRVAASEGHLVEPWAAEVAPEETGVGQRCVELGRPVVVNDYGRYAELAVYPVSSYLAGSEGITTVLCLPLRDGGGAVSVLYIGRRRPSPFTAADIALASALAGQAVLALRNGRLRRDLDDQHMLLEHSVRIGERLSLAADSAGVEGVCRVLAREIGRRVEFAPASGPGPDSGAGPDSSADPGSRDGPDSGDDAGPRADPAAGAKVVAVVAGREHHGDLHIYGRPLTPRDAISVDQATGLIARDIARTRARSLARVRTGAELFRSLLDGVPRDQPHISERARRIGFDLRRPVTVVAIAHSGIDLAELRVLAADTGGVSAESVLGAETAGGAVLAVAMPDGWTPGAMVHGLVAREGVSAAGVSTARRDLVAASDEASACLALGREAPGRSAVFADDLGPLWFLLGAADAVTQAQRLVRSRLGTLHSAQERTGTPLLESLDAYLGSGRRLAAAAEQLGVHQNTLKYRLSRVREHLGIRLDGGTAFELWMALRARDVLVHLGHPCFAPA